jgi:hypothetical protein
VTKPSKPLFAITALILVLAATPLQAWFGGGHMMVAYIAYRNLAPDTRARVDALLKLNPMYTAWTQDVAVDQKPLIAFLKAATWADCIKSANCSPGYINDGDTPKGIDAERQNAGYGDKLMHKYWHYIDTPDAAGAPAQDAKAPNAKTQIVLFTQAISSGASDDVKSYDVVWLEHLVGDIHQPLHAVSRFTKNHPDGDQGGNLVAFCEKPCRDELHAYWDGLLGGNLEVADVVKTGDSLLVNGTPSGADNPDPDAWVRESFNLAKTVVYAPPIGDDNDPIVKLSPRPDANYQTNATALARAQVTLAGYRLAALLNQNLK